MMSPSATWPVLSVKQSVRAKPSSVVECEDCHKFLPRRDLDRHIAHKHAEVSSSSSPQQRKSYKCDACPFVCDISYSFRRHLQTCHLHIAKHPRIVPMLSKEALVRIHKKSSISDKVPCAPERHPGGNRCDLDVRLVLHFHSVSVKQILPSKMKFIIVEEVYIPTYYQFTF